MAEKGLPSTSGLPYQIPALRLVRPARTLQMMASLLASSMVVTALTLIFTPWQQNVQGKGQVVADNPLNRPQELKSTVPGRIGEWHIDREGVYVEEGQEVISIVDVDPQFLSALQLQEQAAIEKVNANQKAVEGLQAAAEEMRQARAAKVEATVQKLNSAKEKVEEAKADERAVQAEIFQMEEQLKRTRAFLPQGISSPEEVQKDEAKLRTLQQKLKATEAKIRQTEAEVAAALQDVGATRAEMQSKVSEAESKVSKAMGDVAIAEKELQEIVTKVRKQRQGQIVVAPRSGIIQKLEVPQGSQAYVKEGDKLAVLVPRTDDLIVEIYVDGMNAPLIQKMLSENQEVMVRLQFEGWPALQIGGWPHVAMGTFGGRVRLVDPSAMADGKVRVLVEPIPNDSNPWPTQDFLRQGTLAKAWLLLQEVPLGFEIWRQLNGFPPSLPDEDSSKPKKINVPK